MKNNKNKGFTLIELMITVAIVGILSAIAIPAYQNYLIRAQVVEAVTLAAGLKNEVNQFLSDNGRLPDVTESVALRTMSGIPSGKYVKEVLIGGQGVIHARLGNEANSKISGEVVQLFPVETKGGNLKWTCISSMKREYVPSSCGDNSVQTYAFMTSD